jgi:NYN domain
LDVGFYIDGFNLYYGGKSYFWSRPGWRWLDLRALATTVVAVASQQPTWNGAVLARLVYCTARTGDQDQDAYLGALKVAGSYDWVEWGYYADKLIHRPLASQPQGAPGPQVTNPAIPIRVKNAGQNVPRAVFMASVAHREEKGSDVNLATHMLLDVNAGNVGAVVAITNDSDLKLPLSKVRELVPVGLLNPGNPTRRPTAGALRASPNVGAGGHWWGHITRNQYLTNQLPDPVMDPGTGKTYTKPADW